MNVTKYGSDSVYIESPDHQRSTDAFSLMGLFGTVGNVPQKNEKQTTIIIRRVVIFANFVLRLFYNKVLQLMIIAYICRMN